MITFKQFDYTVFILRGEPLHLGHEEVIRHALEISSKVIILLGSSNQPRTIKNPWTFDDRRQMIVSVFYEFINRISICPLTDFRSDNNIWAANVQRLVNDVVRKNTWTNFPPKIALIGHSKDASSFYLKLFDQWKTVEHPLNMEVHATDIRRLYFESTMQYLANVVSPEVYKFLVSFKKTNEYTLLKEEWEFIKKYRQAWAGAPYEPTFVTADAVVIQNGHVLLVKRRATPGKGLWAVPGGFVNTGERVLDAAVRELFEETKIDIPEKVIRGNISKQAVFDDPERSLRGRTITHAICVTLPPGKLPKVKGSDDAEKAAWVPLADVKEENMFEDHFHMIQAFVGKFD